MSIKPHICELDKIEEKIWATISFLFEHLHRKEKGLCLMVLCPYINKLMRGQVFEIDGCRIFTFGGAQSHDIDGGILDPNDLEFHEKELDQSCLPSLNPQQVLLPKVALHHGVIDNTLCNKVYSVTTV